MFEDFSKLITSKYCDALEIPSFSLTYVRTYRQTDTNTDTDTHSHIYLHTHTHTKRILSYQLFKLELCRIEGEVGTPDIEMLEL